MVRSAARNLSVGQRYIRSRGSATLGDLLLLVFWIKHANQTALQGHLSYHHNRPSEPPENNQGSQ